jgi:hypothetical protein
MKIRMVIEELSVDLNGKTIEQINANSVLFMAIAKQYEDPNFKLISVEIIPEDPDAKHS